MGDTEKLERYMPQHPLPEGVRKMDRDETVCKYCGVSYLIHNEIKALEDKLKKVQEELEHYKGSEAREEVLKAQLITKDKHIEELNKTIQGKDSILSTLKNELKAKDDEILRAENVKSEVENRLKQTEETLSRSSAQLEKYKLKHGFLITNMPSVLSGVKQLRSDLLSIQTDHNSHHAILKQSREEIQSTVSTVCSKYQSDYTELKEKMLELDNERISFKFKEEKYIQDIASMEAECHKIRTQGSSEQNQQQKKFDQLWNEYTALQSEFNGLREQIKVKDVEAVQYKDQINTHLQNLENMQGQISQREMAMEQATIKQQKDLKEKENELQTVTRELGRMKKKFQEQQEDIEKKSSLSNMKTAELQEQVIRMRGDSEALKSEREMMITAHQNQIEQLRESFKRKLAQNDDWPDRLEAALRKEKDKHAQELAALEAKLKENFIMELQIEKQKHQELLDKYKNENKDGENELQQKLNSAKMHHKNEVSEFHKQLAENKARFRETENTLREEIQSLKKIIHDLEQRLSRLDTGNDTKTNELRYEIKKLESELNEAKESSKRLENQLASTKEEVGFLQETVRRECEERFELTEALSVAKEKLLTLQKPPGGYGQQQNSSRVPSSVSSTKSPESSRTITSSEELAVFRKVNNRQPVPPVKDKDFGSASAVTLGYDSASNDSARGKNRRTSSLSSSRDRIAQAVGRR